jgi:hypothetical protein
LVLQQ